MKDFVRHKVQSPGHFEPPTKDEVFREFSMAFVSLEDAKVAARVANARLQAARNQFEKVKADLFEACPKP